MIAKGYVMRARPLDEKTRQSENVARSLANNGIMFRLIQQLLKILERQLLVLLIRLEMHLLGLLRQQTIVRHSEMDVLGAIRCFSCTEI